MRQEPKQARMCGVGTKGAFFLFTMGNFRSSQPHALFTHIFHCLLSYLHSPPRFFERFSNTTADRRPIDPPPVVQLRVVEKPQHHRTPSSASPTTAGDDPSSSTSAGGAGPGSSTSASYAQSFLQNPYYFMYASLASADRDEELHLLKDGKTRCTTGSVVSSLYHLKDPEADGK